MEDHRVNKSERAYPTAGEDHAQQRGESLEEETTVQTQPQGQSSTEGHRAETWRRNVAMSNDTQEPKRTFREVQERDRTRDMREEQHVAGVMTPKRPRGLP